MGYRIISLLVVVIAQFVMLGCDRCERGIEQTTAQGLVKELMRVGDEGGGMMGVELTSEDSVVLIAAPYRTKRELIASCPELRDGDAADLEMHSDGVESWMVVVVTGGCVQSLGHIDNRFDGKPAVFRVADGDGIAVVDSGEEYRPLHMVPVTKGEALERD